MIGQTQLEALGGRGFVEPVPAPARQLKIDAELKRHAVRHHVDEARCELEGEVGVEHEPVFDGAQRHVAHLDLLGARRQREQQECKKPSGDFQACLWISA
jgi:hypothetical protein